MLSGYQGLVERQAAIPATERDTVAQAGDRIVRLYEDWGMPEKAAEWRRRLQNSGQPGHSVSGTTP
jgi:hypothetical protein